MLVGYEGGAFNQICSIITQYLYRFCQLWAELHFHGMEGRRFGQVERGGFWFKFHDVVGVYRSRTASQSLF